MLVRSLRLTSLLRLPCQTTNTRQTELLFRFHGRAHYGCSIQTDSSGRCERRGTQKEVSNLFPPNSLQIQTNSLHFKYLCAKDSDLRQSAQSHVSQGEQEEEGALVKGTHVRRGNEKVVRGVSATRIPNLRDSDTERAEIERSG